MLNWLKIKLFKKHPKKRELKFLSWRDADYLMKQNVGVWTIAPEEDNNTVMGMVWIERLEHDHG